MERIIDVKHLKKTFGHFEAIKDISFYVNRGQMVAILGPNGAGKSTTINILCTLLKKDKGDVVIDGFSIGKQDNEIRKRIGVVFQNGVLDDTLTIEENLYIRGRFYHVDRDELRAGIKHIAELTEITDLLGKQYKSLSGGQKRRCDIARALLHSPTILFLDEPATGLDPQMRSTVWKTIDQIRKEKNTSIILTTHYMEEAAKADYIFIVKNGNIVTCGTPYELKGQYSKDHMILHTNYKRTVENILKNRGIVYQQSVKGLELELKDTLDAVPVLELCKGKYSGFEVEKGSLEDAYLSIVGSGKR